MINQDNEAVDKFYAWSLPQLIKAGITVNLKQNPKIRKAHGYFSDETKTLFCEAKPGAVLDLYVHEFCHFLQYKENPEKWYPASDKACQFRAWLAGEKVAAKKKKEGRESIQEVELDCEKRVVAQIKAHKLPINIDKYIQEANSYIFSYLMKEKTRCANLCWPKQTFAQDIYPYYPSKFLKLEEYYDIENIPKVILKKLIK